MDLELIERDEGFVLDHTWIDHDRLLWAADFLVFAIIEPHFLEWWPIVIKERGFFVFYHIHQSHDPENLIRLPCPGAARYHQLLWRKLLDIAKHRAQRVGLCHGCFVFARSPGIVGVN